MECMWSIIIGKLYDCLLFVFDKYYKLFFTWSIWTILTFIHPYAIIN